LHPNGKDFVLIAGSSIVAGDLNDPHSQHFLTAHDDLITCIAISNDGSLLASGQVGDNSDVVIWDYATKRATFRLSEHDYSVTNLLSHMMISYLSQQVVSLMESCSFGILPMDTLFRHSKLLHKFSLMVFQQFSGVDLLRISN